MPSCCIESAHGGWGGGKKWICPLRSSSFLWGGGRAAAVFREWAPLISKQIEVKEHLRAKFKVKKENRHYFQERRKSAKFSLFFSRKKRNKKGACSEKKDGRGGTVKREGDKFATVHRSISQMRTRRRKSDLRPIYVYSLIPSFPRETA